MEEIRELAWWLSRERAFQADRIARAKIQRQELSWCMEKTARSQGS